MPYPFRQAFQANIGASTRVVPPSGSQGPTRVEIEVMKMASSKSHLVKVARHCNPCLLEYCRSAIT